MIHRYASLSHFAEHLAPVWDALPPALRGESHAPRSGSWWGDRGRCPTDGLWLVAGYADAQHLAGRRLIYLEHGAGQAYNGDPRSAGHGAYAGGVGLDRVELFLCPSETVADRWRATYPGVPAVAVGCPKLDHLHAGMSVTKPQTVAGATVAFTFHHDRGLCPEGTWAMPYYRPILGDTVADLRGVDVAVIGHGHPRARTALRALWGRLGVEWVEDLAEVFDRADLLAVDNSSAGPEFASLGRPVVWLNAPWFRPEVNHGGRFYEWIEGQVVVDDGADLTEKILLGLSDPPQVRDARARMVHSIYAHTDGHAADRAAAAIVEVHDAPA